MKTITMGIFAHVDGGKTSLTEAMLYKSNTIKKAGRVDHGDSFLDTDSQERARGITIFSKLAMFNYGDLEVTLVDTPGHADFATEAERVMGVLDYAILVINGKEGVQAHTKTLFELLERNKIPTFVFINKMDMEGASKQKALEELSTLTKGKTVDFEQERESFYDELAMVSEAMMNQFLENGQIASQSIAEEIAKCQLIPCLSGSALKLEGIEELLNSLDTYIIEPKREENFGAYVYKIKRDKQGNRLTFARITGGSIKVRKEIPELGEKIGQIRLYSGEKFLQLDYAKAGQIVAFVGLEKTQFGQRLGETQKVLEGVINPVFSYKVNVISGGDAFQVYEKLKEIEEEDPSLRIKWNKENESISLELMGPIQIEILTNIAKERFGVELEFSQGDVIYKETIKAPVEGVGHYEPLRHFAEVHLLLEPTEEGSGVSFGSLCSEDVLDRNWQRLIMTHLLEKEHLGVLTRMPITDMRISILTGKAHQKHTEGGDFRQATYRAVRNGLMRGESILLEPWYSFELSVPTENVGRAMTDIQTMGGQSESPITEGEFAILKGQCPVATMSHYQQKVTAYTKGRGRLSAKVLGYRPCHNEEEVIETIGYNPDRDLENTADSIFCQHGAGVNIKWDQVEKHMSFPYAYREKTAKTPNEKQANMGNKMDASDKELQRIFEKTYGPQKENKILEKRTILSTRDRMTSLDMKLKDEFLIVDGYNIIFAWPKLKELAGVNLDSAREALIEILSNYQGFRKCKLLVVFDSYKVKGAIESKDRYADVEVAFTKEGETADTFIEKITYGMDKNYSIRVATSDALEQNSVLAHGCYRVSARELLEEINGVEIQIKDIIEKNNRENSRNRISIAEFEK